MYQRKASDVHVFSSASVWRANFPQTQRAVVTNVVFLDLTELAAAVFAVISS